MRGPVDSSQLGRVLVHEHVFVMNTEYTLNYRGDFDEDKMVDEAVSELNRLKESGIDTIMDLTVLGLGRYIPRLAKVAERTDINIIAATGCYTYNDIPMPFHHVGPGRMVDVDEPIAAAFVKDITEGIAGTSVKAGALKCAIDIPGLTEGVERVMRSVGEANVRTGTPISVHTQPTLENGLVAQRVLAEEGVDLRDVIIGHSGDTSDVDYLMKLCDAGSMIGMDRFGMDILLPLEARIATIASLIKKGYLEHITLSHDTFCYADFFPEGEPETTIFPGLTYTYISDTALPAMLKAGISEAEIETMLVHNPRRHFEGTHERFAAKSSG